MTEVQWRLRNDIDTVAETERRTEEIDEREPKESEEESRLFDWRSTLGYKLQSTCRKMSFFILFNL